MKKIILSGILLLAMLLAGMSVWVWQQWQRPLTFSEPGPLLIELKRGQSLSHGIYQLAKNSDLLFARYLIFFARFNHQSSAHAGEYEIPPGSSAMEVLERFNQGQVKQYRLTLVEGWTVQEALARVKEHSKLKHSIDSTTELAALLGLDEDKLEGWLYPDTYQFTAGSSDADLLLQAYGKMQQVLDEEWQNRAANLPYQSPYEALIMASIVEKETGQAHERPQIAGVFVRRLQKKMRLETDPTVIYGMGDRYQGNIRRKDLRQPTPYNTYVIRGLPPTPIALAGREALHAALHPAEGQALFFVAKGDGSHVFSATLEEHNKAVRAHQLKRRQDYRSSPSTNQD